MSRIIKKISRKAGLPPGSLVHVGEKWSGAVKIRIVDYDANHCEETEVKDVKEILPFRDSPSVT